MTLQSIVAKSSSEPLWLPLAQLAPHPDNPRLAPRSEIVDQIATRLASGGFDPAHALIVRPLNGGWQIVSGHHRELAAVKAALATVPCWVRDLDDDSAYMLLVTANAQSELTPIERGRHALGSAMDVKAYAASVGRAHTTVHREVCAARVAESADPNVGISQFMQLVEIHAAPGIIRAETGEFVVPDVPTRSMIPLTPHLCLISGGVSGTILESNVAEINQLNRAASQEYFFARDFASCPF
jgi:hypothetical protein